MSRDAASSRVLPAESARLRKLCLFLPNLGGGGAERVMLDLAAAFGQRGTDVELVLAEASGDLISAVPERIKLVDLGVSRILWSVPRFARYLRTRRPDAILSTLNHANLAAIWGRRLSGVCARVVVREANVLNEKARSANPLKCRVLLALMRRIYPWADRVVAVSQGVADELVQRVGLDPARVQVIYNPVISPEFHARLAEPLAHPWFAPNQPPTVLSVGRLAAQKDFPTLIHAFAAVRKRMPARLMILGEGEARGSLEALLRRLGLHEHSLLPGFVPNPLPYLKRAALFVLSSAWEGLPNALIQALAVGTPIVATDCRSGPKEILQDGRWGRLVPVGDPAAMAGAIVETLTLRHVYASADEGSRLGRFSLDEIVSQYTAILQPLPARGS